jgi:ABC-type polysaccharide/polyol phosphate export permease
MKKLERFRRIVKRTLSFSRRELKLRTRYKWAFLSNTIVIPLLHALPMILLYWGIFSMIAGEFEEVNAGNYLPWLLLGALCYQVFFLGNSFFKGRFIEEKYWTTITGTLIAPISKYYLLFGVIIQLGIEGFVTAVLLTVLSFIALPTTLFSLFLLFLIFLLTVAMGAALGLINGTFFLTNENYCIFFDYLAYILAFTSTYSIPYEVFSSIHPIVAGIVQVNPLYHIIKLTRSIWFGTFEPDLLYSLLYVVIFVICLMIIGVYLFSKITRRYGVRGY